MSLNKSNDSSARSEMVESKAEQLGAKAENKEIDEITRNEVEQHTADEKEAKFVRPKERNSSGITKNGFPSTESLNPESAKKLDELKKAANDGLLIGDGGGFLQEGKAAPVLRNIEAELKSFAEDAIKEGAPPTIFECIQSHKGSKLRDPDVVDVGGGGGEIAGNSVGVESLYGNGTEIAQLPPPTEAARDVLKVGHDGLMLGVGVVHGAVNFLEQSLIGAGDMIRMAGAVQRRSDLAMRMVPDSDPEGTKKLDQACSSISMGSRVLLQYNTTLNSNSRFYGKDFDPEARKVAIKLAETMPEKLKEEIAKFEKGTIEQKAAASTELALNIVTLAQTGELAVGKVSQLARESKFAADFNNDMRVLSNCIKDLHEKKLDELAKFIGEECRFGPRLAHDGPPLKGGKIIRELDASVLEMRKPSGAGKSGDRSNQNRSPEKVVSRPEFVSEIKRGFAERQVKPIEKKEGQRISDSIREELSIDETQNIAVAQIDIKGFDTEGAIAISGRKSPEGTVEAPIDRLFRITEYDGAITHAFDTEVKILEALGKKLEKTPSVEGTINLYTERYPCTSCIEVIEQFNKKFENININITFTKDPPLRQKKRL